MRGGVHAADRNSSARGKLMLAYPRWIDVRSGCEQRPGETCGIFPRRSGRHHLGFDDQYHPICLVVVQEEKKGSRYDAPEMLLAGVSSYDRHSFGHGSTD